MMADIDLFGVSFENVKGFKLPDGEGGVAEFVSPPAGTIEIGENGTYDVSDYAGAAVNVLPQMNLQEKTVTPSTSRQEVRADTEQGYDALEDVIVEAVPTAVQAVPSLSLNPSTGVITATALQLAGYVSGGTTSDTLALSTQAGTTITPTESQQTAVSAGKYTTGAVNVDAIPSNYVGSAIDRRDSTDLTASGGTVTAPAGYYASSASKSVASGSAATPATTITATPTISVNSSTGVITASVNASQSVTPTVSAGYVSAGTAGTITASGSDTEQLSVQAGTTITPTESQQVAVAAGKYTTGAVNVGAISSTYVGSGIDRNDSTDLSVSGATVQVPKGYYESNASKAVANGSVTAPSTISGTGATVSTGTNTLTLSKTVSVTPSVTTAGYISSGTAGNSSVSLTANVTTQAAQTIHPSTSDQTIASGRYLTGNQTIKAVTVSGLSADKILSGTTVKIGDSTDDDCVTSVSGSVAFQTIYTGSSAPSPSLGVDGDIYIQTA